MGPIYFCIEARGSFMSALLVLRCWFLRDAGIYEMLMGWR